MSATRRWSARRRRAFFVALAAAVIPVWFAGCGSEAMDSLLGGLFGSVGSGSGLTVATPALPVRVGDERQIEVVPRGDAAASDITAWHLSCSSTVGTITGDGVFTAQGMGSCTVWATYRVQPTDPNNSVTTTSTNRVTFDIWPRGPSLGS